MLDGASECEPASVKLGVGPKATLGRSAVPGAELSAPRYAGRRLGARPRTVVVPTGGWPGCLAALEPPLPPERLIDGFGTRQSRTALPLPLPPVTPCR
ncbi:hypothetical protein IL38_05335 [Actinopolyspora erythraea]|uniref:Uncharacterized protein n=1 Tax=Actinopolyspora erythraea TaxID=414996 RepID=A0ABR4X626_9ACTN|nr:hypothetical protein IL38_05335 [Actinopolyspora erythraea]